MTCDPNFSEVGPYCEASESQRFLHNYDFDLMTLSFFLQEDPGGHVHYVVHFFSALKIWFYYALAFQRSLLKTKQKANQKKKAFKRKTSWQEHFPQCMYCKTTAIKKHTLMCQLASNNQCF